MEKVDLNKLAKLDTFQEGAKELLNYFEKHYYSIIPPRESNVDFYKSPSWHTTSFIVFEKLSSGQINDIYIILERKRWKHKRVTYVLSWYLGSLVCGDRFYVNDKELEIICPGLFHTRSVIEKDDTLFADDITMFALHDWDIEELVNTFKQLCPK